MVRPQQSNNVLKLRRLANELRTADWPDEEPTNPVIVNVMPPPPTPPTPLAPLASRTILGIRHWTQVAALGIVAAVVIAYLLTR